MESPRRVPRATTKRALLRRQEYRCSGCAKVLVAGQTDFDHRVPWSLSKNSKPENLHALCAGCHAFKTRKFDAQRIPRAKALASKLAESERVCYWCMRVVSKHFADRHECDRDQVVWEEMARVTEEATRREDVFQRLKQFEHTTITAPKVG